MPTLHAIYKKAVEIQNKKQADEKARILAVIVKKIKDRLVEKNVVFPMLFEIEDDEKQSDYEDALKELNAIYSDHEVYIDRDISVKNFQQNKEERFYVTLREHDPVEKMCIYGFNKMCMLARKTQDYVSSQIQPPLIEQIKDGRGNCNSSTPSSENPDNEKSIGLLQDFRRE
jgi:hypothetical protein